MYEALPVNRYQEADVGSLSPEKMIVLLYEKLADHLAQAEDAHAQGAKSTMLKRINSAQRIIMELRNALDHSLGGEISRNLESLYDFMFQENLKAVVENDPERLHNVCRVLEPLLAAWQAIPPGSAESALAELTQAQMTDAGASGQQESPTPPSPNPLERGSESRNGTLSVSA
jgi:flagellar protein FliS